MAAATEPRDLDRLIEEVGQLRDGALELESEFAPVLAKVPAEQLPSARNLLHYLAMRQHDIRDLQGELSELGLSSLGRMEPHALASLEAVLAVLHHLAGRPTDGVREAVLPVDFRSGAARLAEHTAALLGPLPKDRAVRVMVTMPSEAADDYALVRELVATGMDVMRINCAHDQAAEWMRMAAHARRAEQEVGRPCRVMCDLAGPKLRTGALEPGPGVVRWWPLRDDAGQILAPARVRLVARCINGSSAPVLPLDPALLAELQPGDELHLVDVHGRARAIVVSEGGAEGAWAHAGRKGHVAAQTPVELFRGGQRVAEGRVGDLPPVERSLRLAVGDRLEITAEPELGRPALRDEANRVRRPARIGCTLPEVFRDVRSGHRVLFDDGKIGAVVREAERDHLEVEIVRARSGKAKLRGDLGINLPDTDLQLPALTDKDREDLGFIAAHADMVALSFLRRPEDVEALHRELDQRGDRHLGIVLKIETQRGFDQLPRLLLAALRGRPVGVMVARGDLGVELGFERLAEVQEEILWLCEAAHVPVIWATQVLESLAKKGMPSRAEVTDAAMGGRAECVMLNKGPHIIEAVRFLCDVLERMQGHQEKKRAMLRKLGVSRVL